MEESEVTPCCVQSISSESTLMSINFGGRGTPGELLFTWPNHRKWKRKLGLGGEGTLKVTGSMRPELLLGPGSLPSSPGTYGQTPGLVSHLGECREYPECQFYGGPNREGPRWAPSPTHGAGDYTVGPRHML